MVAALAGRDLGRPVNRKRVQRLMREHRLLQRPFDAQASACAQYLTSGREVAIDGRLVF
jgi:hypothetical protein